jgi:hypothetical protein
MLLQKSRKMQKQPLFLMAKKIQGALVQFVKCQFMALALMQPSQLEAAGQLQEHEFALLEL